MTGAFVPVGVGSGSVGASSLAQYGYQGKSVCGDNSGSSDFMQALKGAFKNNWDSTDRLREKKTKTTYKLSKETVEVLGDVDGEEYERQTSKKSTTSLDQVLAMAFTHNSANANVAALASLSAPVPAEASRSTRQLAHETCAETSGDSQSVEPVISSSTKHIRKPPHPADWNANHLRASPRRKGKRPLHTPTPSPCRK